VFLAIGLDVALFPRHERPIAAVLAILVPAVSIAVPLVLRPAASVAQEPAPIRLQATPAARRVYVVAIDGLSPADVAGDPAVARVPWLAQLARRGAMAPLATVRPTEGPPVWGTIMTGRLPRDHGIRSASCYRLLGSRSDWTLLPKGALVGMLERARLLSRRSVPSTARRRRALWNVLDAFGIPSGLVGVFGTHPPETVRGFVVSPYFHMLRRDRARLATTLHPQDLLAEVAARALEPSDVDPALLRELADPSEPTASPLDDPAVRRLAEQALAPDLTNERVADVLRQAYAPSFFVMAFHGYDEAGHQFYRYAHPEAFGNVHPDEARRYGHVLSGYTALIGRWVLGLEKALQPGDVLVVLSGHGLAPTPLWRRLLGVLTGTEVGAASHADAPPGVFVAVGEPVRTGAELQGASVLDVAPTLLYLMGLPVARDMEGRVLNELIAADFASDNPVTFIPSYESLAVAPAASGPPGDDLPPLPDEQP
jgi:predicted AlkP superfamily phosphohydrolase/phosphomutase